MILFILLSYVPGVQNKTCCRSLLSFLDSLVTKGYVKWEKNKFQKVVVINVFPLRSPLTTVIGKLLQIPQLKSRVPSGSTVSDSRSFRSISRATTGLSSGDMCPAPWEERSKWSLFYLTHLEIRWLIGIVHLCEKWRDQLVVCTSMGIGEKEFTGIA